MKFKGTEIHHLTFPTSAVRGYRKQDVDDFLLHTAKDYKNFEQRLEEYRNDFSEAEQEKEQLEARIEQMKIDYERNQEKRKEEIRVLRKRLDDSLKLHEGPNKKQEDELVVAQKIALSIEKEANERAYKIVSEANDYYESKIKDAQLFKNQVLMDVEESLKDLQLSKQEVLDGFYITQRRYLAVVDGIENRYQNYLIKNKEMDHSSTAT